MTPQSHNLSEQPLVSRPHKGLGAFVPLLVIVVVGIPISARTNPQFIAQPEDVWAAVLMILICGISAVAMVWPLIHCRIVAQKSGITLTGFFRSTFHPWEEIEDYELRFLQSGRAEPVESPSTPSKLGSSRAYLKMGGQWLALPRLLSAYHHHDELLETIEREAKWSRAREWQLAAVRDDGEWPRTFVYQDVASWKLVGLYLLCTSVLLGVFWLSNFKSGGFTAWDGLSFWGRVAFVMAPTLMYGSPLLIGLAQYPAIKMLRRYLDQKIVATPQGLTHFQGEKEIFLLWDEIESYYLEVIPGILQPDLCVIESQGARIEFLSTIENVRGLVALVKKRAQNAKTRSWLHLHGAGEDVLGGAASLWPDGNVGVGTKIHHHRTRSARAILALGFVMLSVLCLLAPVARVVGGRSWWEGIDVLSLFFLVTIGVPTLWGLLGYLKSHVQCEADGLRQTGVWGEKKLLWEDVEKFERTAHWFVVTGSKTKIRIALFLADLEGLKHEITEKSGQECVLNNNAF